MVTPPQKRVFEDFTPGEVMEFGPRVVTREEIIAFASEFDPQPFHLDEDAARGMMIGTLCASGWHSCGLMMRMLVDGFVNQSHSMGAGGVEQVKWLRPLLPNTAIRVRAIVLDVRASRTKPDRGFVRFRVEMLDDAGRLLMLMVTPLMIHTRQGVSA